MAVTSLPTLGTQYTLDEWATKTGAYVGIHQTGARYIPNSELIRLSTLARWQLHHLTDYVVSSNIAGTTWLTPRTIHQPTALPPVSGDLP